ncbi:ABC transporter permease [Avrilella dinanensis]|uniref:ABC transporter n=1 Tax=Avrilella dinanensis TaxID=2008672 RepID=A0A2M9R7U3_9FLAO|nr:ABC transporter permease [Avrilella dinanensis]PJR04845.1 ABC transporter [Avrilella dinanensis]
MRYKLWQSVKKEMLLLSRDWGGLVILFVMPLVLVITVTLIQDSSFKAVSTRIEIAFVDNDKGEISKTIIDNLSKSESFVLVSVSEQELQHLVFKGKYQMGIVIPENLSSDLQNKVNHNVDKAISAFGLGDDSDTEENHFSAKEIKLYFDPATHLSFKSGVQNAIDKIVTQIENQSIYRAFQEQLSEENSFFEQESLIVFEEILPTANSEEPKPNSVQHNIAAWTLFAMFFIVVPLSVNMVKEKNQGTYIRLLTSPVSHLVFLGGKIITYLIICLLQFYVMLFIGKFVFPYFGLIALEWTNLGLLTIVALFCGLAAIGFGVLLGTYAETQEQSAPFGATSVIILAALGGVWVPVFAMPDIMQGFAKISPMNWGLNAFYDILLRQGGLSDILPDIILLFLFFVATLTISIIYDKKKRTV